MPPEDLVRLWEEHARHEFSRRDTEATLTTLVEDAYVHQAPLLTGGAGRTALRAFLSRDCAPNLPPDAKLTPISRTAGEDQPVDEMIFSFTPTQEIPWTPPVGERGLALCVSASTLSD
jgi:carboxymethylenebutenolidase